MPDYYSTVTGEKVLDYPAEAAALFPTLKPVPSSKKNDAPAEDEIVIEITPTDKVAKPQPKTTDKNEATDAK